MPLPVTALVLAAGSSTRMGTSKQLLQLGNKTILRHCVDALAAAGIEHIVVVCGSEYDACADTLKETAARIMKNGMRISQMADSVRIGLGGIDDTCSGVLVCLADHPLVEQATYKSLAEAHRQSPEKIIVPVFEGRRGHPVLFPFSVISEIFFLPSLRDVVRGEGDRLVVIDVLDEGIVLDMDTEEDYRAVAARFAARIDGMTGGEPYVQ